MTDLERAAVLAWFAEYRGPHARHIKEFLADPRLPSLSDVVAVTAAISVMQDQWNRTNSWWDVYGILRAHLSGAAVLSCGASERVPGPMLEPRLRFVPGAWRPVLQYWRAGEWHDVPGQAR